jgi:hypothetical protein
LFFKREGKMKKNKILFVLALISLILLATSSRANATEGACIYWVRQLWPPYTYACSDDSNAEYWCDFTAGFFYPGKKCCGSGTRTYYPNFQQGCCSIDNTCTSGVIDMDYYATCLGYECNEGDYVCNNGTCESSTLITLKDFKAYARSNRVILAWATESETDNAGFNIYRSESENGQYTKINTSIIPAKGSSTQGAVYEFTDNNVQNRKTYYYKLEDIDLNGNSTMHSPKSATPGWLYSFWK